MLDVEVIADPPAAVSALDPIRSRLLAELSEPASAATLASRVGIARQKVNYHLRALEQHQLVAFAGERQWGGLKERLLVATAASYVVSPSALGPAAVDPGRANDRLSASYLIAVAARAVCEVGELWRAARDQNKRLATLSIDTAIRFRSPARSHRWSRVTTMSPIPAAAPIAWCWLHIRCQTTRRRNASRKGRFRTTLGRDGARQQSGHVT